MPSSEPSRKGDKSEEETEKAKQVMLEFANGPRKTPAKPGKKPNRLSYRANEAMIKAQEDIIGMTISEITATRQELEDAVNNPDMVNDQPEDSTPNTGQREKFDPELMTTVLREMRAPLHNISGFARLVLEDDVTDGPTRKEFLSIVVQQSETLTRLLDDFSGKYKLDDTQPAADVSGQTA